MVEIISYSIYTDIAAVCYTSMCNNTMYHPCQSENSDMYVSVSGLHPYDIGHMYTCSYVSKIKVLAINSDHIYM